MISIKNKKYSDPEPNDFYVGRGSPLGNVFSHLRTNHPQIIATVNTREEAVEFYKGYLYDKIKEGDPEICNAINSLIIKHLKGQDVNLTCYCSPNRCHAEVIKEFVESSNYCVNWFSNMRKLDRPILYQKAEYWTVENFYQAMKTTDSDLRAKISKMNPHESKKFTRSLNLRVDWEEIKLDVMEYALKRKFAPGTSWHKKLMSCNEEVVEWNNCSDKFWGVSIFDGEGDNRLGKIIQRLK